MNTNEASKHLESLMSKVPEGQDLLGMFAGPEPDEVGREEAEEAPASEAKNTQRRPTREESAQEDQRRDDVEDEETEESAAAEDTETEAEEEQTSEAADADAGEIDAAEFAAILGVDESAITIGDDGSVQVGVKVNGEKSAVTVPTLVESYQLVRNLHMRTEEVSKQQSEIQAEREQTRQQYLEKIQAAEDVTTQLKNAVVQDFRSVDWKEFESRDPGGAALERQKLSERYSQFENQLTALQQQRQQEQEAQLAEYQQQKQRYMQEQWGAIVEAIPEFGDEAKRPAVVAGISSCLKEYGFTDQEMGDVVDNRLIRMINDLRVLKAQAKGSELTAKKVRKVARKMAPGTPRNEAQVKSERSKAAMSRLKKSGSTKDAATALLEVGII